MTVAVGDVVRIVAEWDMPLGTISQMVYHYIGESGTTATDLQVATSAEAQLDLAFDDIDQHISNQVTGSTLDVLLWDFVLNRWDGIADVPLVGADGISVSEMLSHGDAALAKFFTDSSRRQGRKYIPGMVEPVTSFSTITAAVLVDIGFFAAVLDNDIVAGGLTLRFGTFNTDPLSPLFETFSRSNGTVLAESIIAYQRRRRPGTGI